MQRFNSKKDSWLIAILFGSNAALLFAISFSTLDLFGAIIAVTCLASIVFITWLVLATFYVLDQDSLSIRSGPYRWTIPLSDIQEIVYSSNPMSSPALSLKRLKIVY